MYAELTGEPETLVLAASDGDHSRPCFETELTDKGADGAGGAGYEESVMRLEVADVVKTEYGETALHWVGKKKEATQSPPSAS